MSQDLNLVRIRGAIVRAGEIKQIGTDKMYLVTVAGEEDIVGNDGRARTIPFYQPVEVRYKEGEGAAKLAAGTPVFVEGSLKHRQWDADNGEKMQMTRVRARLLRALHGVPPDDLTTDAQGGFRLKGGYCRFTGVIRTAGEPDYKALSSGAVLNLRGACGDQWKVLEDGALVDKEHTNWFRMKQWGPRAQELAELGIPKGTLLLVEASIENGSYVDTKSHGRKVYTTDLNLTDVQILGRMGEAANADSVPGKTAQAYGGSSYDDIPDAAYEESYQEEALPF